MSTTVNSSVAALIVSHDGARWLPAVIEGLGEQRAPVDAVVAVDTTSRDESTELLRQAFGSVVEAHGSTSFPDAVTLGLEHVGDCEWVWLLHDDSRPDPGALEALLAAAEANPDADILGPKLREWPSLRRLLELGVTISGTGRRETGLERGEFDQGQHDEIRTVLAVNTAGMLVRRSVLEELGGFDPQLPIFGNDIDFGWRAAAAGHRTIVVPQAVVFHAEAAHRGVRRTPITGRHTHYQERRAALYTLLVNAPARWLPFQVLRLGLGTLIRMLGFLLVRQVGQSLDELAALVSLYSSPRELLGARRLRARRRPAEPHDVRHLLAPRWLPYRHGLDFVSDLAAAATMQASDVAERRRAAKLAESGTPVRRADSDDEEDDLGADTGFVVRFLTNPVAVLVTLFVIVALFGARDAFGAVSGGALSPAPGEAAGLVAAPPRLLARHRPGHAGPRAGVHPAARDRGLHPRRESGRGRECAAGAGRADLAVGCVAPAARGRAPGRRRGLLDLAGRLGRRELRAAPGRQRGLGRGAPGGRGHRRAAAVARPCRARVRRPGGRSPLARRLALRAVLRAGGGLRPDGVLGRSRAGRSSWSASAS